MKTEIEPDDRYRDRMLSTLPEHSRSLAAAATGEDLDLLGNLIGMMRKGSSKDYSSEVAKRIF